MQELRDYTYHEATVCLCPNCLAVLPGKIILQNDKAYLLRHCPECGQQIDLLEEYLPYWLQRRKYDKPGNRILTQTKSEKGCPFDCGLCPQHEQHSCIGIIEVADGCDLGCPVCYASSRKEGGFLSVEKVLEMARFFVEAEGGKAEIVQISGGEPAMHPDILDIISRIKELKVNYVMLNTNGLRIAREPSFAMALGEIARDGGFEVYLQFDGFSEKACEVLRGRNLIDEKMQAIRNLQEAHVPMSLVMTVARGVNEAEIRDVIDFAMSQRFIRGVNIQPVCYSGRLANVERINRVTLSGVIENIYSSMPGVFKQGDILPLPCNVERVAVSFLFKDTRGNLSSIADMVDVADYLDDIDNTFAFDLDGILKKGFACSCCGPKISEGFLKKAFSFLPKDFLIWPKAKKIGYVNEHIFRLTITFFLDRYNFDIKSAQKECVHIITPDLKRIPFSMYNMLYRERLNRGHM